MMDGSVAILLKDYKEVTEKEKKVSDKKSNDQLNQVVTAKKMLQVLQCKHCITPVNTGTCT